MHFLVFSDQISVEHKMKIIFADTMAVHKVIMKCEAPKKCHKSRSNSLFRTLCSSCFNCMCLCDLILTGPGTQMSKMKVSVDKIISLSESDGVDELQKHLTLMSDDQVCVSVYCSEQSLCKLVSNHVMYKASSLNYVQMTFKCFFVLLQLTTMLTNSALKGKDTGVLIKAIFKGNDSVHLI